MKLLSFRYHRLLIDCALLLLLHSSLLLLMDKTRVIEKMMALQFGWGELLLITAFIICRLGVYFLVAPVLLAIGVHCLVRRFFPKSSPSMPAG